MSTPSTTVTYVGHATVLVRTGRLSFLTDPVFSPRVLTARRHSPLPEEIAQPSAVFISHAHYDHLDIPTFKYFSSNVPVILPRGLGRLLRRFVRNPLIEMDAGETREILPGLTVAAFPVRHFGFRLSGLTYRGCLGYWIASEGQTVFFPGDTGYMDFRKFHKPDLALLPVGPCRPEWMMRSRHLNPEDVLQLTKDLDAKLMIPIHWGTFRLGWEPLLEPIEKLQRLLIRDPLASRVRILPPGTSA